MVLSLTEKLRRELERYRNKDFVKAVVAVCALTAAADPKISLATRYRVDAVLDRLDLVQLFDRAKITELLDEYIAAFGADPDRTAEILHNKIRRVAADYKKSRTLLRIAYLIIVADGVVTPAEQAEFNRLCGMLSIEPGAVESGLQTGPVGA
jgi:tellurite resistance protein TerB